MRSGGRILQQSWQEIAVAGTGTVVREIESMEKFKVYLGDC